MLKLFAIALLSLSLLAPQASIAASGETALVTGANRGIGLELARQLSEAGYKVIGTARKPAEAKELKSLGAQVVQLDVTDPQSVAAMAATLDGVPIDLLINNAGVGGQAPGGLADTDFEKVKFTFDVNSLGPMRVTQALLPNVQAGKGKTIAHISSRMGSIAQNSGSYYGYRASKSALNMLNSSLAMELKPMGITAVVLHPGWVQTRMGGAGADITVDVSVAGMLEVISALDIAKTGHFYNYSGEEIPW